MSEEKMMKSFKNNEENDEKNDEEV